MKTTEVFSWNLAAYLKYKGTQTLICNQGGQGSSKNVSILQLLYNIAKYSKSRKRITIASYALPHLKEGAIQDFEDVLTDEGIDPASVRNKSENKYFIGKCKFTFVGIEGNEAKATGPRREILYINEANRRIAYKIFELMNARTSIATFIDFNPSAEFWLHEKHMPNFDYVLIKSTFLDNPYLPKREKENLLAKKDKPGFENWWKVYGLGELGQLEGAIFTNWRFGEFDETLPFGYGLDFGVTDPDALVKVAVDKKAKKIYWHEELYENNLSTDELGDRLKARVPDKKLIAADNSAKRTIKDLAKKGFNIHGFPKNKIVEDIKEITGYEIIITPESTNLEQELNKWIWLDKKGEIPIDAFCHLLDGARYKTMQVLKPFVRKGQKAL
jgi:phage terminase large subunit